MEPLRHCYQWFLSIDSAVHASIRVKFPKAAHALDVGIEAAYEFVCRPAVAIILSLLLVPLVATGKISVVVAVPIAAAVLVVLLWLTRSPRVRRLSVIARSAFMVLSALFLCFIGLEYGKWALVAYRSEQEHPPVPIMTADLGLYFFGKSTLAFDLVNFGSESAQKPKYWMGIVDLTHPYSYPHLPNIAQPLPIPAKVLDDFVRPGSKVGTFQVLSLSEAVERHVKPEDKLFGLVWVTCLNCVTTRAYWVYFQAEKGGWYAYDPSMNEGGRTTKMPVRDAPDTDATVDALVPPSKRTPIQEKE